MPNHYFDNSLYKARDINNNHNWLVINYFHKLINDKKNDIIIIVFLIY